MRSLPVMKAPALPARRALSSAALKTRSSAFRSVSKNCARRSTVSANTLRAINTVGRGMAATSQRNQMKVITTNKGTSTATDQAM
jgi:hypothetical protein